jgi:two-component system sensor histidine kinase/response regulator
MTQVEERLRAGDREGARILAHTLKGLAEVLGMVEVLPLAAALDHAIKCGSSDEEILIRACAANNILRRLVDDLGRALPGERLCIRPRRTTAPPEARAELRHLIETDDLRAIAQYRKLESTLYAMNGTLAERLGQHLRNFAYPNALETLNELERTSST